MRALLPVSVAELGEKTLDALLDDLLENSQYRSDPEEWEIREKYIAEVRKENHRRVNKD
jgi:hypothetical protein